MNKAGIDYAIASPAICIDDNGEIYWYFFTESKKQIGLFAENIYGIKYRKDEFDDDLQRFDWLSSKVIELLEEHNVEKVSLEGYSMGSTSSRIFQIGENTGILKKKLIDNDYKLVVIPPTMIKKFATGKGNANKQQMISAFLGASIIDLFEIFQQSTIKKPLEDIVDSYFILRYIEKE